MNSTLNLKCLLFANANATTVVFRLTFSYFTRLIALWKALSLSQISLSTRYLLTDLMSYQESPFLSLITDNCIIWRDLYRTNSFTWCCLVFTWSCRFNCSWRKSLNYIHPIWIVVQILNKNGRKLYSKQYLTIKECLWNICPTIPLYSSSSLTELLNVLWKTE